MVKVAHLPRLWNSAATLTKTIGIGVLWLLTASTADAAPHPRHASPGPPATRPSLSRVTVHVDPAPHFQRAKRVSHADDDAAIQNDAPAAGVAARDDAIDGLRPIGFLVGSVDSHPHTLACSPRSPRGPPTAF